MRLLKNENSNNNRRKQMVVSFLLLFSFIYSIFLTALRTMARELHITFASKQIQKYRLNFSIFELNLKRFLLSTLDGDLIWTKFMSKLFWQQIILSFFFKQKKKKQTENISHGISAKPSVLTICRSPEINFEMKKHKLLCIRQTANT